MSGNATAVDAINTALRDSERMLKEPAMVNSIAGMFGALLASGLALLVAYGVDIESDRVVATLNFIAVAIPLVTIGVVGWRTRNGVYAPATVDTIRVIEQGEYYDRGYESGHKAATEQAEQQDVGVGSTIIYAPNLPERS